MGLSPPDFVFFVLKSIDPLVKNKPAQDFCFVNYISADSDKVWPTLIDSSVAISSRFSNFWTRLSNFIPSVSIILSVNTLKQKIDLAFFLYFS